MYFSPALTVKCKNCCKPARAGSISHGNSGGANLMFHCRVINQHRLAIRTCTINLGLDSDRFWMTTYSLEMKLSSSLFDTPGSMVTTEGSLGNSKILSWETLRYTSFRTETLPTPPPATASKHWLLRVLSWDCLQALFVSKDGHFTHSSAPSSESAHIQWWLIRGYKALVLLLVFGGTLGHPSSSAPNGISWGLCWNYL